MRLSSFLIIEVVFAVKRYFGTFPVGSGWVRWGWVGSDDGKSDNRANSLQLELELGLSLAIF